MGLLGVYLYEWPETSWKRLFLKRQGIYVDTITAPKHWQKEGDLKHCVQIVLLLTACGDWLEF